MFGVVVLVVAGTIAYDAITQPPFPKPELFARGDFTSATLAEAINHFVSIGEEASVRQLKSLTIDDFGTERVGWVCRVLFVPKGGTPLRPPYSGALDLPWRSMPAKDWPMYPLASSGSSYFLLSHGYIGTGLPESGVAYIDYCRRNGVFRTSPVGVPSRVQAMQDAAQLRRSDAWRAIKWADSGPGFVYFYDEETTWGFISNQANSIP